MEYADVVAVVGLHFGNVVRDLRVEPELAFENVAERERRCGADLREAGDVENRIRGSVVGYDARRAVGQDEPRDRLVEYTFGLRAL